MCLLTFLPAGAMPDTAALRNGSYLNNDGHGFAVVAGDHLIVRRGLDAEPMIEAFDVTRREHPDGPALFHSRLATHGQTGLDNCHPFPVGGDNRTVLAHNGVLPAVVQPAKTDPRSDTRIAAEEFIPAFGSVRSRRTRLALQRWMTPQNKVAILTVDRRFKQRAYLLNEKSGIWNSGIWYSNDSYCLSRRADGWPGTPGQTGDPGTCWSPTGARAARRPSASLRTNAPAVAGAQPAARRPRTASATPRAATRRPGRRHQ